MNRTLALALALLVVAVSLTACAQQSAPQDAVPDTGSVETPQQATTVATDSIDNAVVEDNDSVQLDDVV